MVAIVRSGEVRAVLTQYAVPGWGDGELWTGDGLVLAHDFRFAGNAAGDSSTAVSSSASSPAGAAAAARAASPLGDGSPPSGTVARNRSQVADVFVASPCREVDPEELVTRFRSFLAGDRVAFHDVALELDSATPFQQAVASALRGIPRGEVMTYAELAAHAGYPRAQRAVGTFCANNRFMFLLPCHRVVGAHGIGGYGSSGVGAKRRLLALEGTML